MQRTILMVGQSNPTQQQLSQAVPAELLKIIPVETCDQALDQIDQSVALVLLHPRISGETTLPFIKTLRAKNPYLPVILAADEVHLPAMLRGLHMGANDVIQTPLDAEIALARIKTQLEIRDMLEAREMEIDRLRRQKAAQERLVRMVTHDLKHPMGNIRMAEGLLRHYMAMGANEEKGVPVLDSVLIALNSMQEALEDFDDAFRLNQGMNVEPNPIAISRLLHDSVLEHLASATNKNMTLDVHPTELQVMADRGRMRRVIDNLISNAIKYSPPGSVITLWAESNTDDDVRICVQDQGPGIPKAEHHLLFTEFGKLSTRPTGQETSTGLGLWIVKMFIEGMGGQVGVNDAPRAGSIFWVELPAARDVAVTITETQEANIVVNYHEAS